MFTVEDALETLCGFKKDNPKFNIERSDFNLVTSLARQVFRGTGLTDRQYELAKQKLLCYQDQFLSNGITNLESCLQELRIPLRQIDRTRYIKIVYEEGHPYIHVRFTFQKKLISAIEAIRLNVKAKTDYDKTEKIHKFEYDEKTLFIIIDALKDKNFELDETCKSIYEQILLFSKEEVVPGIYNNELKNLPVKGIELLKEEIGSLDKNNLLLYKDRALKYGIEVDNVVDSNFSELANKIANRQVNHNILPKNKYNLGDIFLTIEELKRLPILVVLPSENPYDVLVEVYSHLSNLIDNRSMSVLFRLENDGEDGTAFNNYIKEKKLNNSLDIFTKVVYINETKLPKTVAKFQWDPKTILVYGETKIPTTRKILDFYSSKDLILFYRDNNENNNHFSRFFFNTTSEVF